MAANPKLFLTTAPENGKEKRSEMFYPADFVDLFVNGLEQAAQIQKKALEAAEQQTAEAIEAYKKATRTATSPGLFDVALEAFDYYVQTQKKVIDQIVEQTAAMIVTAKLNSDSSSKVAADFTKIIQQSIERAITVQKYSLDLAAQQAKAVAEHSLEHWMATRRLFEESE